MQRRATMSDVAERAGVSRAAVSQVLNGQDWSRVSEAAAERIRAAADELSYRPNLTARSLRAQKSHVLGFVSEWATTDRHAGGLVRGALRAAKRRGYVLFITETEENEEATQDAVDALIDHQIDGLIYAATRPRKIALPPRTALIPHVTLNGLAATEGAGILPDESTAGQAMGELLLGTLASPRVAVLGLKLGHPAADPDNVAVQRRALGIASAFARHRATPVAQIDLDPWTVRNGYQAMRQLLSSGHELTGIICLNDRLAIGAYRAILEAGLRIPDDIAIVSFDGDEIADDLDPTLTTAALPYEQMGDLAVELLLSEKGASGEHLVDMPIRQRGSIARST